MKNKKNRAIIIIAVLVIILGVGYAIVTGTDLILNGSASVKGSQLKVKYQQDSFSEIGKANDSEATVTNVSLTDTVATFKVEDLSFQGDYVEFSYVIENIETDLDALLNVGTKNIAGNTEYFDITTTLGSATVEAEGQTSLTVKVELKKLPIDVSNSSAEFTVTINATPVNS